MGYMTQDFAKKQTRTFNVYFDDKMKKDAEERKRQQIEHEVREIARESAEKKSKKSKFKKVK